jgi:hypothetical protein
LKKGSWNSQNFEKILINNIFSVLGILRTPRLRGGLQKVLMRGAGVEPLRFTIDYD